MSALTWDEAALSGSALAGSALAGSAVGRPRRHLTLVPTGSAVAATGEGVQLTRRGRLSITLLVVAAVLVAAFVGMRGATATPGAVAPIATVSVASGETLSAIAARELPSLPVAEGVARIQIANNLSTTAISAGQTLSIPAP